MLEARFATVIVGNTVDDPLAGACLVVLFMLGLLAMQAGFKPLRETQEEAEHWSSPNKMSLLASACTLVISLVGLVSVMSNPDGAVGLLLSLLAVMALITPLVLTIIASSGAKSTKSDETSIAVTNPLHNDDPLHDDEE